MTKRLTASQWAKLQPERKPEPASFPLSLTPDVTVVAVSKNGAKLVARN
jgi:hypothetical protein